MFKKNNQMFRVVVVWQLDRATVTEQLTKKRFVANYRVAKTAFVADFIHPIIAKVQPLEISIIGDLILIWIS